MSESLAALAATAAAIGFVHTLIGPDHYVPFIAMARARGWSLPRTVGVTLACGVGHVLGSVALGAAGIGLGWALTGMVELEAWRGEIAGWLLLGFGVAYTAWGLRRAIRNRPHDHWHAHGDGRVHRHQHRHRGGHVHVHDGAHRPARAAAERSAPEPGRRLTPWVLFTLFVFGPCEPLIPVLMVPAARGSAWGVALVTAVFGLATLATMTVAVVTGTLGLARWRLGRLEPWSHSLAGAALVACGLAIRWGL